MFFFLLLKCSELLYKAIYLPYYYQKFFLLHIIFIKKYNGMLKYLYDKKKSFNNFIII